MKRTKKTILAVLAAALLASATVSTTVAYFSTYAETEGGMTISYWHQEEITEDASDLAKDITITADKDSAAVYVRARAYTGSEYTISCSGAGWTDGGDGWWYYSEPIADGASTGALHAEISNIPAEADIGDGINISVVYESTLVCYRKSGETFEPYADWDAAESGSSSGTADRDTTDGNN